VVLLLHSVVPHAHAEEALATHTAVPPLELPVQHSQLPEHHLENFRQNDREVRALHEAVSVPNFPVALATLCALALLQPQPAATHPWADACAQAPGPGRALAPPALRGPPVLR
jgi:hypothetical protein